MKKLYSYIPCKVSNKTVLFVYECMRGVQRLIHKNYKGNYECNRVNFKKHYANFKSTRGFIENQRDLYDLKYGSSTIGYAGCEIIAAYNAILDLEGKPVVLFIEMIKSFEKDGMANFGRFGTSPPALRDYLNKKGYETIYSHKVSEFDEIGKMSRCVILTLYNDGQDIRKMIHTIALTKKNNEYIAHNAYGNNKAYGPYSSVSDFIGMYNNKKAKGICIIGIR